MKLSDYLHESGISLNLAGKNKQEIIQNLVDLLTKVAPIQNTGRIVEALEEREKLKTTGIGSGIAIPHCKSDEVDDVCIAIGISKDGLEFESLDEKPAKFLFLLVAPEKGGSEHLKASAKIVRLFRDPDVQEAILKLDSSAEVMDLIKKYD